MRHFDQTGEILIATNSYKYDVLVYITLIKL